MTDDNTKPHQRPNMGVLGERERKYAPAVEVKRNPWDHEPAWPGAEDDDDEAVADGMSDDDGDDPPPLWTSADVGFQQPSLWDEAIARIFASRSRSDSP
jgi:hypothetical protein